MAATAALIAALSAATTSKLAAGDVGAANRHADAARVAEAAANQRADNAVTLARQQADAALASSTAQLDGRSKSLDKRQVDLDARERAVAAAEAALRATSFADGSYQVAVDIQPGTYHAPGTSAECVWKKLSPTNETIENYKQPGPAVVVIEPTVKIFVTRGCGLWTKR
jgi:hypothetical protein